MIPFSRDEDFVQRGIILDQIHQLHNQSDPWTVLVGLGGVGYVNPSQNFHTTNA